jgi:hypothetical protein
MHAIVYPMQRVTGIMSEISAAVQKQYAGIEQVNRTATRLDESTYTPHRHLPGAGAGAGARIAGRARTERAIGDGRSACSGTQ